MLLQGADSTIALLGDEAIWVRQARLIVHAVTEPRWVVARFCRPSAYAYWQPCWLLGSACVAGAARCCTGNSCLCDMAQMKKGLRRQA
jgi:hypothetical protein